MKRGWLIVIQIVYLISIPVWSFIRGLSWMLAYDGDVYTNAIYFVWAVAAYPYIMVAASIWAWIAFRTKPDQAGKIVLIPIAYALLIFILLAFGVFG
jgi:hypothetical protein